MQRKQHSPAEGGQTDVCSYGTLLTENETRVHSPPKRHNPLTTRLDPQRHGCNRTESLASADRYGIACGRHLHERN